MSRRTALLAVMLLLTAVGAAADENDEPANAPFVLSSQQQAELDQVLRQWEEGAADVKLFEWSFTRWAYDPVFGPMGSPSHIDKGAMKYVPPKKWSYCVEGPRTEHWMWNGQSLFEFDNRQKRFIEHGLPAKWSDQGDTGGLFAFFPRLWKAMVDGPLQSLLFTTEPSKLKDRYFMRIVTPAEAKDQVWLEAYPRFEEDAVLFQRAELILAMGDKQPYSLRIHHCKGKGRTAYLLRRIATDKKKRADAFKPGPSSD